MTKKMYFEMQRLCTYTLSKGVSPKSRSPLPSTVRAWSKSSMRARATSSLYDYLRVARQQRRDAAAAAAVVVVAVLLCL